MHDNYTVLDIFEYSTEAQVAKTKLEAEGLQMMLMDEKTVQKFELMWVTEPENTAELGQLANLTEPEDKLFKFLQKHLIRLEQERISYTYLLQQLAEL